MSASNKSDFWKNKEKNRQLIKDLMSGVNCMRQKHLIQNNAEADAKFEKRKQQAQLNPLVETQINGLIGKGLSSGISINTDDDFIYSLNKNFDGFNRNIFDFSKDFYKKAETYSEAYAFIDFERIQYDENNEIINKDDLRAYVVILDLNSILHTRDNGKECTYLRFKDYQIIDDGFNDVEKCYIKEFKKINGKVYYSLYEKIKDEDFTIIDNELFFLDFIPIVDYYPNGSHKMFDIDLFWNNCANLNIGHFNAYSHFLHLSKINSIPVMLVRSVGKQAGDTIEFGAGTAVCSDSEKADIKFVEPSGAGLQGALNTVKKLEDDVNYFGLNVNVTNSGNATATASAIEESTINSILSARMQSLQYALERIIKIIITWESFRSSYIVNKEYKVDLNTEFNNKADQLALTALLNAFDRQAISKRTLTDGLIKLGFLNKDFDIERDAEIIDNEINGLSLLSKEDL